MESELEKFRKKKKQEIVKKERINKFKEKWDGLKNWIYYAILPEIHHDREKRETDDEEAENDQEGQEPGLDKVVQNVYLPYVISALKFFIWIFLQIGFMKLEFGAVFFFMSLIWFVWKNTGTKKDKKKVSAYSVFNENCEAISGSLKAEHFENQMLFRNTNLRTK